MVGRAPVRPPPRSVEETKIIQIVLPPVEPDKPEVAEEAESASAPSQLAPPTLPDVPTVAPIDAFLQRPEVPSSGLPIGRDLTVVPVGRGSGGRGHGVGNLFDLDKLDTAPQARIRTRPQYPPDLRREGVCGEVEIEYVIDTDGTVAALSILRASRSAFEGPVRDAVSRWTFRPGRKNGRAVNTRVHQVIAFTLDQ